MKGNNSPILLTKDGFKKLQTELIRREGELRTKLQDTLNQMRRQGDLKENDGYSMAVEDFQNNEEKILVIRETLEQGVVVAKKKGSTIEVGSSVTIQCTGGKIRKYSIVGEDEANPLELKISYKSPIGKSLMGKKKGSKISIDTPSGKTECTVIEVE